MMENDGYLIAGELARWPTKQKMARLLEDAGLKPIVGKYSVRVGDCESWSFESFGFDNQSIAADAETLEQAIDDTNLISKALGAADVRFEVYSCAVSASEMLHYAHHRWPIGGNVSP